MSPVKIIFFDIDGTMIDMKKKVISEKMKETLIKLKESGVLICIATGRTPVSMPKFDFVDFDAFLTFNGSYCFNRKDTISSNPIPAEDVKKILKNAESLGRPVSIATKERVAANGKDQDLVDYYHIAKLEVVVAEDFDQIAETEDIYQIMCGCYKEEYEPMMKHVDGAKITAWWDRAVDIIPATSGKGTGVEKILEYYHLDKSEALAFGDGNNDIELLQAVGCGIAMGNASEQLKLIADDICGHVAEDGIYHYCLEHGLI